MEFYTLKIILRHLQHIVAVGQEHVAPLNIFCHILIFALFEILKFCFIVALYPACFIEAYRLPATLCIILIFEAILDNLELQLSYGAYQFAAIMLIHKKLCNALHALPLRRETWFSTNVLSGIFFSLFPSAVMTVAAVIASFYSAVEQGWQIPLLWMLGTNL